MNAERKQHVRDQINVLRGLCQDYVWNENDLRIRNAKLLASVPELLDWLTEELDNHSTLCRMLNKALVLTHIVGANGGMTDKDHATEEAIRKEAGIK